MLLLQKPRNGLSLKALLSIGPIQPLGELPQALVYSRNSKLQATVLSRVLTSLTNSYVFPISLNEFSLFVAPYVEIRRVWAFVDNNDDLIRLSHLVTALGLEAETFGPKGVSADHQFDDAYQLTSLISALKAIVERFKDNKRVEAIKQSLDTEGIEEYLTKKKEEIGDREPVVSQVFYPANEYLGIKTAFEEPNSRSVALLTNEADVITVRKRALELRRSGYDVKEVMINVDPAISPIYLLFLYL